MRTRCGVIRSRFPPRACSTTTVTSTAIRSKPTWLTYRPRAPSFSTQMARSNTRWGRISTVWTVSLTWPTTAWWTATWPPYRSPTCSMFATRTIPGKGRSAGRSTMPTGMRARMSFALPSIPAIRDSSMWTRLWAATPNPTRSSSRRVRRCRLWTTPPAARQSRRAPKRPLGATRIHSVQRSCYWAPARLLATTWTD